ncbi:hypothetical protein AaE_005083 [Aphanomyces astaci]|uniref:Uncharacterized protein n=1 Tax=Aphanomyces astaci TaxID=112090 RepID=A0A6A5AHC6_APHAT|nr:hypothetical protein AaE_005083 [Aphanomyces astaci]
MTKYSALYSDFVLCDGTHNATKYVMNLMPFTIVDALDRSTLVGVALDYSENSTVVTDGLQISESCGVYERQQTLALDELISCVQNECLWSPYADRQWKQNYNDMHKYPHVQQQGDVWGVSEQA